MGKLDSRVSQETLRLFAYYINEREAIRLARVAGQPWPWSKDPAFQKYRYTNIKRVHDRTTALLKAEFYDLNDDRPFDEILRNCALFRYFGTIDFARGIGWQRKWDAKDLLARVISLADSGVQVFTGAYIITNSGIKDRKERVVINHYLDAFASKSKDLAKIARETASWEDVARAMYELPGFGGTGFMTKEVLQDAILTPVLNTAIDKDTWTPVGPGARRGLSLVMGRDQWARVTEPEALEEVRLIQKLVKPLLKKHVPKLNVHDIQFALCELSKYWRATHGEENKIRRVYRPPHLREAPRSGFGIKQSGGNK